VIIYIKKKTFLTDAKYLIKQYAIWDAASDSFVNLTDLTAAIDNSHLERVSSNLILSIIHMSD